MGVTKRPLSVVLYFATSVVGGAVCSGRYQLAVNLEPNLLGVMLGSAL